MKLGTNGGRFGDGHDIFESLACQTITPYKYKFTEPHHQLCVIKVSFQLRLERRDEEDLWNGRTVKEQKLSGKNCQIIIVTFSLSPLAAREYRGGLKCGRGLENCVPAVAYHFWLNLPEKFLQSGAHFLAEPFSM